jgi:predicted RNA-binding Zn-ribbon protein involved in translation (DUF1610 family)
MVNEQIHFFCAACGMRLTVPKHLAGVTGPCPSCGNAIQAPLRDPRLSQTAPLPTPPPDAASRLAVKPEPRSLPNRPAGIEIPALRSIPQPEGVTIPEIHPPPSGSHTADLLRRILMAVIFIVASGALVYGVLTFLKRQPLDTPDPAPIREKSSLPAAAEETAELPIADAPALADGLEPVSPWQDAEAVLEQFLAAQDLAARLPLMETQTAEEELAATCLAKPLPAVVRMVPQFRETDTIENRIDCFYTVEFQTRDSPSRVQTILVRTRGGNPPRIVADAFLDTYGGRLAAYAAKPSDKAGFFRAVVYAVAACSDPTIPNHEKKLTLKLLACDNAKEIASASFSRHSKIAEMLENGSYELSYGSARPCTVMLRWNTEEDPDRPFLEAIAIRDFGWNS